MDDASRFQDSDQQLAQELQFQADDLVSSLAHMISRGLVDDYGRLAPCPARMYRTCPLAGAVDLMYGKW